MTVIVIPILFEGRALGSMTLAYRERKRPETEDLSTLQAIGQSVALAIINARQLAEMQYQAHHDSLTALPNRQRLHRDFAKAVVENPAGGRIGLVLLDLNRFKEINDLSSVVRHNLAVLCDRIHLARRRIPMRVAPKIVLSLEEVQLLEKLARGRRSPVRLAQRSTIVLLAAERNENKEIASQLGITRETAGRWRRRYAESGMAGIEKDAPRPGRIPSISATKVREIVRKTTRSKPKAGTHWSSRTMAAEVGVSASSVRRVWKRHGLKPHLVRTFKVSNDPKFIEELEDVVGLYLNPPEHALVLSVDEKSQIQALDRTQPGLPLKKRSFAGTMTHDYKRNGTTTLFAALNTLDGTVISTCMPRHRHQEWVEVLEVDRQGDAQGQGTPSHSGQLLSPTKRQRLRHGLPKHPRFHMHFTPTSASWLNMVERFFRDLTTKRLRRGVFCSVPELIGPPSKSTSISTTRVPARTSGQKPQTTSSRRSNVPVEASISRHLCDALH